MRVQFNQLKNETALIIKQCLGIMHRVSSE